MAQPEFRKKHGYSTPIITAVIVLMILAIASIVFSYWYSRADFAFPGNPVIPPGDNKSVLKPVNPGVSAEPFWPKAPLIPRPRHVKGIYLTAYTVGKGHFPELLQLVNNTELNAMVIDLKDDLGRLTYGRTIVPWAAAAGAPDDRFIPDPVALVARLAEEGIYPIARIVAFKDNVMTMHRPDLAALNSQGQPWHYRGSYWLDPYNKENWKYLVALAREAAELGFREIQFDYVRFPSDGDVWNIVYPAKDDTPFNQVIPAFLRYARASLAEYDVEISADIYGLVPYDPSGQGIGQHFESIAAEVDLVCPMVYPSHYGAGNLGLPDPDSAPYDTVYRTLDAGLQRLERAELDTLIRPWLQSFTIRHTYRADEIRAQIQAAEDLGIHEFLLWNAANYYNSAALRAPDKE